MNDTLTANRTALAGAQAASGKRAATLTEHIVEIVSDSGEGAQRCGQSLGAIAAKMGNGVWTVEIIPAEIQPPPRSIAGASGNRVRLGSERINNGGDEADLAPLEQVGRPLGVHVMHAGALQVDADVRQDGTRDAGDEAGQGGIEIAAGGDAFRTSARSRGQQVQEQTVEVGLDAEREDARVAPVRAPGVPDDLARVPFAERGLAVGHEDQSLGTERFRVLR